MERVVNHEYFIIGVVWYTTLTDSTSRNCDAVLCVKSDIILFCLHAHLENHLQKMSGWVAGGAAPTYVQSHDTLCIVT